MNPFDCWNNTQMDLTNVNSGRRTAEAIREILEELSSIYMSDDDSDEKRAYRLD